MINGFQAGGRKKLFLKKKRQPPGGKKRMWIKSDDSRPHPVFAEDTSNRLSIKLLDILRLSAERQMEQGLFADPAKPRPRIRAKSQNTPVSVHLERRLCYAKHHGGPP
jgi:hypothetical protein